MIYNVLNEARVSGHVGAAIEPVETDAESSGRAGDIQPGGWLVGARAVASPNRSDDPPERVELVVVHCISLPAGSTSTEHVEALFTNSLDPSAHPTFAELDGVRVSAHLVIDRAGRVTQFVPFERQAWHAGVSAWRGRPACNRRSIGIELIGTDDAAFTAKQYARLAAVLESLFDAYPALDLSSVVGHEEVAPERKTDPGPRFDWVRLYAALTARRVR